MRIAVLADIHGNVRALRAVMDDLKQVAPDRVINLGDYVSGPLEAAETADVLISLAWTTIRGNHDRQLLDQPVDQMGRSDQAAFCRAKEPSQRLALDARSDRRSGGPVPLSRHARQRHTYLLETVEPDGKRALATPAEVAGASTAPARDRAVRPHPCAAHRARSTTAALIINPGSVGLPAYTDDEPVQHANQMGAPHARYARARAPQGRRSLAGVVPRRRL